MGRQIEIRQAGRIIDVPDGRTILERALEEGIAYPHGCRSGRCGSCKSRPGHSCRHDGERSARADGVGGSGSLPSEHAHTEGEKQAAFRLRA
ncbi:2Fe-2S iron-sulfur cluster-binding protein [Bacillus paralicheniformis]|uniref:2Fe-2S iron-sulfur cluster-binding protein n=1 Tax=Bacillus paralicheniformis TaxID=1648923 RepID=UPI003BF9560D